MKLLGVERSIGIYNNASEERIEDIVINISVEDLQQIVVHNEDDPLYYDGYILEDKQLQELAKYADKEIAFDFLNYYYVLQGLGIYDWGNDSK
jgi:hypothetical protein